jgi:hypothetical protein
MDLPNRLPVATLPDSSAQDVSAQHISAPPFQRRDCSARGLRIIIKTYPEIVNIIADTLSLYAAIQAVDLFMFVLRFSDS